MNRNKSWLLREIEEQRGIDIPTFLWEAYYAQGMTLQTIADELGVCETTVNRWIRDNSGYVPFTGNRRAAVQLVRDQVRREIEEESRKIVRISARKASARE